MQNLMDIVDMLPDKVMDLWVSWDGFIPAVL